MHEREERVSASEEDATSAQVAAAAKSLVVGGYKPTHTYILVSRETGLVCARAGANGATALLFFSTPFLAFEYSRVLQLKAAVQQIDVSKLPEIAAHAATGGATGFILNRCPRCNEALLYQLESLKDPENVKYIWALSIAMSNQKLSQAAATAFLNSREGKIGEIVPLLVHARDHVDAGSLLLQYMLACAAAAALPAGGDSLLAESKQALTQMGRPDLVTRIKSDPMGAMAELMLLLHQGAQGNWNPPTS